MITTIVFSIESASPNFRFKCTLVSWFNKQYIAFARVFNFNFFGYTNSASLITPLYFLLFYFLFLLFFHFSLLDFIKSKLLFELFSKIITVFRFFFSNLSLLRHGSGHMSTDFQRFLPGCLLFPLFMLYFVLSLLLLVWFKQKTSILLEYLRFFHYIISHCKSQFRFA
jgi:hypothetical protein